MLSIIPYRTVFQPMRKWKNQVILYAWIILLIGQTNNTTTTSTPTLDLTPMVNVIVAVIPLFVLVAVIKILFRSFKDVA